VRAIIVAPLLHQDQFLGLIEVFSRRPFAFGMHDLQALEDLANRFTATLRLGAGSPKVDTAQEPPGVDAAPELLAGERSQRRFSGVRQFSLYALAVIACILIGFYAGFHWVWQPLGPMTNAAEGQITSTPPALPAWLSRSDVVQGTLMQSVDPTYPADALRQRLQGQVVLQIWISKDGSVYAAKTMRGDPILSQAALEAVRHWRFSPYRMNDKPFDVPAQITFEFNLAR
jgi:TonB family protein